MGEFDRPFLASAALGAGKLTLHTLRKEYARVYRDVYVRKEIRVDATMRAEAALLFGGAGAVLAGMSAAAALGTKWIDDDCPAEVVRQGFHGSPVGLIIRSDQIASDEQVRTAIGPSTSPARTAFDLGRRLPFGQAVEVLDALCRATSSKPVDVVELIDRHRGCRGLVQLRRVLDVVDAGAESPQETRTRLLLIANGLPRPSTQLEIRDEFGYLIARADMGWWEWQVVVEYDGEQHWTDRRQRAWDIDRTATLEAMGWRIVRVR